MDKPKILYTFKQLLAYICLFICYIAIVFDWSYKILTANKPLGLLFVSMHTLAYYLFYVIFNHLIIKRFISNRIIVIIEILLFVTIFTILFSNAIWENRLPAERY